MYQCYNIIIIIRSDFPLHSFRNTTVLHNETIEFTIIFMAKLGVKHVYDYG